MSLVKSYPVNIWSFNSFFFCFCKEFFDNASCIFCMVLGSFPGVDSSSFGFIGLCDLGNNLGIVYDCGTKVPGSAFDSKNKRVFQGLSLLSVLLLCLLSLPSIIQDRTYIHLLF